MGFCLTLFNEYYIVVSIINYRAFTVKFIKIIQGILFFGLFIGYPIPLPGLVSGKLVCFCSDFGMLFLLIDTENRS